MKHLVEKKNFKLSNKFGAVRLTVVNHVCLKNSLDYFVTDTHHLPYRMKIYPEFKIATWLR